MFIMKLLSIRQVCFPDNLYVIFYACSRAPSSHRLKGDVGGGVVAPTVTNTTLNVCRLFGTYSALYLKNTYEGGVL